jgi:hypothetical protein
MPKPFVATHIDQDLTGGWLGHHENELFFNCKLKDVRGAVLKDCKLQSSAFVTDSLEDLLGITLTLDCGSFANVEFSPLVFDAMLMLLIKTKGNVEKRKKLIEVLGEARVRELLWAFKGLEKH